MKAPTDQPPTQTKVRALLAARMVTSEDASDNSCSRSISDLIGMHALAYGHTSPHAQDLMRRQLQDGVFEEKQAVILGEFVAVHDAFQNQYPECKVSFDAFCRALPWNALEASQVADGNISCSPHGCFCSQCLTDGTGPCLRQGISGPPLPSACRRREPDLGALLMICLCRSRRELPNEVPYVVGRMVFA